MHLQQDIHAECQRRLLELPRRAVIDRRHDDQDAVSAPCPCFGDLIYVVHEVLAQDRELGRGARGDEVLRSALEGGRIGEHRETSRAAPCIGARQRRHVEFLPDKTLRGACFFDLRDQSKVAGGKFACEGSGKSARSRS